MADSVEPENTPRRRRRAASRPAGPPAEVVPTAIPEATFIAPETSSGSAEVISEPSLPSARPTRRRASRRTAPATAPEPVLAERPGLQAEEKPKSESEKISEAEKDPESEKKQPRKRARNTLSDSVVETGSEEATKDGSVEKKPKKKAEKSSESDEEADKSKRSRGKKKGDEEKPAKTKKSKQKADKRAQEDFVEGEPAEEQNPIEEDDVDDIARALEEAQRTVKSKRQVANPFVAEADRDNQLEALAGAIAAGVAVDETVTEDTSEPAVEDDDEEDDENGEESEEGEEDRPSRRRRRRGGRRRRRGLDKEEAADESPEDAEDTSEESEPVADEAGTTRRRRRRRRRGGADDQDSSDDEVTGIEGSTRMEAKRQRRKESRAAGRRRAPILSEAEFLTRRESVARKMIVRQGEQYTQLAVLEDDILVEHYVDRPSASSLIGNIYLGKVQNVLPSMEAAFIDIGRGRNAVLYAGEVDWESFGVSGENRKVENVLKSGQSIVVQVTKDPVGQKGARLTHHISIPGRYIVYSPGGHLSGISRKLPDTERSRLRDVLADLITDDESVIVRTAAEGVGEEDLIRDVNRLKTQWEIIEKRAKQGGAPQALYAEPDLTLRIIRDLFTEDFGEIVVQGDGGSEDAFEAISAYVEHVAPGLLERVHRFEIGDDGKDVFARNRIDEQIAKALDRKVFLPSGGSLVIDRTEAMTVIDVNTGRFTGSGGNLEATVTSNNLEAAEEIVRQLRLRDLGGIIVIDFIDMVLPSNRELLLRRLVECLGRDRTRHQVAEVTSLGLVQLTRKRIGTGLAEAFTEECETCHGTGYHRFEEPVDSQAPADGGDRGQRRRRKR